MRPTQQNGKGGNLSPLPRSADEGLTDGRACLAAALRYLALGWHVLADCPPDHVGVGKAHARNCSSLGKSPVVRWAEYQTRPPAEQEVLGWWRWQGNANVAVALGRLLRIDVDGPGGEKTLRDLSRGDLPRTPEFDSGRDNGGRGLLYAAPPGVVLRTSVEGASVGQELRLQGLGAQTVLPPSRHHLGSYYAWRPGRSPHEVAVAPAPAWLVEVLQAKTAGGKGKRAPVLGDDEKIEDGKRDTLLTSLAGTMRRRGMVEEEIYAALVVVNDRRCQPPLDDDQVRKIAESIAKRKPADVAVLLAGGQSPRRNAGQGTITFTAEGRR
jgi:putative DNA primase/helicase